MTKFPEINPHALDLGNGYRFEWMLSGDEPLAEIHGLIRDADGVLVPSSMGWYGTADPQTAALRAAIAFNIPL